MGRLIKIVIGATTVVVIGSEIYYYVCKLLTKTQESENPSRPDPRMAEKLLINQQELEKRKPSNLWNTVFFTPDVSPEDPHSSTSQLIYYFLNARVSIRLCVYLVSHPWLVEVIKKKHEEGLMIQVVTDYDTFTAHQNFGPRLWGRAGAEVRMQQTGYLMHHKFAIIDEEAVMTGSLNWTKQGIAWNQENIVVSTNERIVQKYMEEFNTLWRLFYNDDRR